MEGCNGHSTWYLRWVIVELYELQSKLLKGGYIGDYIGDDCRGS